ncbi:truB protein [Lactobacillus selangorensis]|uniref:tRNA pseudouridine synthase B n=1 Tax=Lactobacillus selangorensis TaxID=81857 RepID=A0A0R2G0T1_9LACO|nr:tRNA pseudouridine(55) synthase TruB [Lactobacillus selangorensis]KRN29600.1 truB protein [Lactobacillus selangorensis]KRN33870.1 truB protein [Lactobacillus selangorensis]
MDGIIPLYKPRGMTSFDCVAKVRRIVNQRRVGHSGTLDPDVDGVLPICVGQATKVVELLMNSGKTYQGEVTLGFATTTEDLSGDTIATKPVESEVPAAQIDTVLQGMLGENIQIPPMYSAVKVNGRRLYEYARAGETVERPQRKVVISRFERDGAIDYSPEKQRERFKFQVDCSKGTYVRTLAVDVGKQLGYPAVMSDLTRLKSGGFQLGQCVTLAQLAEHKEDGTLSEIMQPLDWALRAFPRVALTAEEWAQVRNGVFLELNQTAPKVSLAYEGHIKALYQLMDGKKNVYRPDKMFLQNEGVAD